MVHHVIAKAWRHAGALAGRLARDRAGNVLALAATCIPPILILVGGGVDMSRAYMAQTSLQNACDAGVLAGRRAQAKSGVWTATEQGKAQRMFSFNFQGTSAGASATTFTPVNEGGGVVSGTATTTVPTTIMKMFGTNAFTLTATCSAEFQISNIDVMMVLDTTGSMACRPDGTNCLSDSTSKIEGLKSAIRSFYYTIASAVPAGGTTRVRFGFVPYAGTVNLRALVQSGDIPQGYLAGSGTYQTLQFKFDQPNYSGTPGSPQNTTETYGSAISQANCTQYGSNTYPTIGSNPVTTGTSPANTTSVTYSYRSWTKTGTVGNGHNAVDIGTCVRNVSTVTTTYSITSYSPSPTAPYRYTQATLDTSAIKTLSPVSLATGVGSTSTVPAAGYTTGYYDMVQLGALSGTTNITKTSYTWTGCIEERSTVNTLISAASVPAGATDLDLATAPTTTTVGSQWKPYVANVMFDRGQAATLDTATPRTAMTEYCVPAAQKLTTVDTSNAAVVPTWVENYLGTLTAWGGTYHDIGMIWGARLANPNGIMSANVNSGNLLSVSRNLIFLTDGDMSPYCRTLYSAYGLEYLDHRAAPATTLTGTACDGYLTPYHNGRFLAACQRAKDMGYTVWVIGFGQTLTTEMTSCASAGRAFYANDTSALQSTFRQIASQVADLRLKT